MAILCKPAIAVPEYIITMEQTLELCQQIHAGHPQLDLALRLLQNTGIRKRHIVLPVDEVLQHRGFEERNSTYEEQSKRRTPPDGLQKGKGRLDAILHFDLAVLYFPFRQMTPNSSIRHIGPKTSVKRYLALGHSQSGASVQDRSDTFQTG